MFRVIYFALTVLAAVCSAKELRMVSLPDGRIVGGADASIYDFPHQISMRYNGVYRCGGSIFSENIVLSASHCVQNIDPSKITIVAGSSLLSERKIEIPVEKVIMHPKFKSFNNDYDVTILILSEPLRFEAGIQPIPLAKERSDEGTIVTVTGWGTLEEGGYVSNQLQKVEVNVVSKTDCKSIYSSLLVTDRMLCAGVTGGGKDACQGDSGGPLIVNNHLLGIVSWGAGCAREDFPGVYASIPDLFDWIVETALENSRSSA